jgi:hypothetical protein
LNVAELAFPATATVAGAVRIPDALFESVTVAPLAGTAFESVT